MKNRYCVCITYKCDWDCSYCIVDTHNQLEPDKEDIFEYLNNIPVGSRVSLAGGEPGMSSKNYLLKIIDISITRKFDLTMDTNGLFFKRYPELLKYFNYFFYHCSDTLHIKDIFRPDIDVDFDYVIVASDDNYHLVKDFLEYNNDLKINVHKAIKNQNPKRTHLSIKNALGLYKEIKHIIPHQSIMHLIGETSSTDNDIQVLGTHLDACNK